MAAVMGVAAQAAGEDRGAAKDPCHFSIAQSVGWAFVTSCLVQVGKDKLTVRYNGPAQHDNDVGSIQVGGR